MKPLRLSLMLAAAAVVVVIHPLLVHELVASGRWPGLTLLAGLLPAALLAGLVAFNSRHRAAGLAALLLAAALVWNWRAALQSRFEWVYLVQHLGAQLFLCWLFGRSLLPGREALVTRLATRARGGNLPAELLGYTRRATLAWALFFALVALLSLLLFVFAPLALWSLFANVLTLPLAALMFLGEYLVRRLSHRGLPHVSLARSVQAFWSDRGAQRP